MRIGVDAGCWANRRGFGRFTRASVGALARLVSGEHELVLLLDRPTLDDPSLVPLPDGAEVHAVEVGVPPAEAAAAEGARSVRDVLAMSRAMKRARCDVVWFPASYSWFPIWRTPSVVTMHDAIAETLPDLVLPTRADRVRWRLKQRLALWTCASVVTVSETSRQALMQHLGVDPARLHVVHEATDPRFKPVSPAERDKVVHRYSLHDAPYLLYVGGISPHKNLQVLIDALPLTTTPGLRLVIVGDTDDDPFLSATAAVRAAIAASPTRNRVVTTGFVPDADLPGLYAGAVATAQPSLSEGFGLTAAESAACGTPVIASGDAALRELLGGAGRYANAADPRMWAREADTLAQEPAQRAAAANACLALSRTWSWDACARDLLPVLVKAAAGA